MSSRSQSIANRWAVNRRAAERLEGADVPARGAAAVGGQPAVALQRRPEPRGRAPDHPRAGSRHDGGARRAVARLRVRQPDLVDQCPRRAAADAEREVRQRALAAADPARVAAVGQRAQHALHAPAAPRGERAPAAGGPDGHARHAPRHRDRVQELQLVDEVRTAVGALDRPRRGEDARHDGREAIGVLALLRRAGGRRGEQRERGEHDGAHGYDASTARLIEFAKSCAPSRACLIANGKISFPIPCGSSTL